MADAGRLRFRPRGSERQVTAFLDTNLLIYAQGAGDKGETARQAVLAGGVISVQILNECTAVLRRKFGLGWPAISEALSDLRTALHPVRPITVDTHLATIELAGMHGFSFYDALIVASALEARCDRLLTEDLQAGRRINGLTIVNPFA